MADNEIKNLQQEEKKKKLHRTEIPLKKKKMGQFSHAQIFQKNVFFFFS